MIWVPLWFGISEGILSCIEGVNIPSGIFLAEEFVVTGLLIGNQTKKRQSKQATKRRNLARYQAF